MGWDSGDLRINHSDYHENTFVTTPGVIIKPLESQTLATIIFIKDRSTNFLTNFFTTQNIGGKLLLKQCIRWLGNSLYPFKAKGEFRGDFKWCSLKMYFNRGWVGNSLG